MRVRLVIVAAFAWLGLTSAHAATVAVMVPPRPHPDVAATLSRLHGELLSVGAEVELIAGSIAAGRARPAGDAVMAIVGDQAPLAVDVWVTAKPPRVARYARVTVEPGTEDAAGRLAIRAIEVLRSSFLEGELTARARQRPPTPPPVSVEEIGEATRSTPPRGRYGLELGAALLAGLEGAGAAVLPVLRVDWAAHPWLLLQATVVGPGTTPSVATAAGEASIDQHHGVLGACLRLRSTQRVRPFLGVAAGALRTSVRGRATLASAEGHSEVRWSLLAEGSAGFAVHLGERYSVTLAAHAQVAQPYIAVHFGNTVVSTSARPNLLFTLTAGAWL